MNKGLKFILIIIISVSILIPLIFLLPSNIGTIESEDGRTIVSYCGSIIGGPFTLIGVLWTIKETKKDKTLELHIQYSPLLYIKKKEYALSNVEELEKILFNFEISNSGRSEAKKVCICLDEMKDYEYRVHDPKGNDDSINYEFIPQNTTEKIKISFSKKDKSPFNKNDIISTQINIVYQSIFNEEKEKIYNLNLNYEKLTHFENNDHKYLWYLTLSENK